MNYLMIKLKVLVLKQINMRRKRKKNVMKKLMKTKKMKIIPNQIAIHTQILMKMRTKMKVEKRERITKKIMRRKKKKKIMMMKTILQKMIKIRIVLIKILKIQKTKLLMKIKTEKLLVNTIAQSMVSKKPKRNTNTKDTRSLQF